MALVQEGVVDDRVAGFGREAATPEALAEPAAERRQFGAAAPSSVAAPIGMGALSRVFRQIRCFWPQSGASSPIQARASAVR